MIVHGSIACLIDEGFADEEFEVLRERLDEQGYELELIGEQAHTLLSSKAERVIVRTDVSIDHAGVAEYVGLFIPGGNSPTRLLEDDRFKRFIRDFDASRKPIAAPSEGQQLVVASGVGQDDQWVASASSDDLEEFSASFIGLLHENDGGDDEWEPAEDMISEGSPVHPHL